MSNPNLKILDTVYARDCGFIIAEDKITKKRNVYFGRITESNEKLDTEYILTFGAKLPLEYFESFMDYRVK